MSQHNSFYKLNLASTYSITSSYSAPLLLFWLQPRALVCKQQGWSTATDGRWRGRWVDVTAALSSTPGEYVSPAVEEMKQKWWSVCFLTFCLSLRPHQGWASQTSSVNLGLLPSVSLSAAGLGGGRLALAENDPSGLIVFWSADWHWEEKQRCREKERGGWVLMHLAAIREAYLAVWTQWANIYTHNVHTLKWLCCHLLGNFPLYTHIDSQIHTHFHLHILGECPSATFSPND